MHRESVCVQFIIIGSGNGIGGGDGVNVRMQFSQQDKNGEILAHATLRPSFLVDSVPTSSFELFLTQVVVPWDVDCLGRSATRRRSAPRFWAEVAVNK